jgi:regulator of ribonuclease activity A
MENRMNDKAPATCDLCDAHKGDTDGDFRVLPPVFRDFGRRLAFHGPVSTVKCFEDNSMLKAAVESPGQGRVLVVDGAGLVIDGAVRDVAELAACDVGIRALAPVPLPTDRQGQGQRDVALQIRGVWVRPGDWLYADADGIVVLPHPA